MDKETRIIQDILFVSDKLRLDRFKTPIINTNNGAIH